MLRSLSILDVEQPHIICLMFIKISWKQQASQQQQQQQSKKDDD